MKTPAISIVMSVYNGEKHLAECMDSLLAQSFTDFEFIVVDDASTDATPAVLADYARRDARVRVLTNEVNMERSRSRNRAINAARAPLVVGMDADDWSHPERLAMQYAFMQAHPEVTVCGTWLGVYDTGELWEWAQGDADIRAISLFNSCVAGATAIFCKDVVMRLAEGYDVNIPSSEDYDLWARLMEHAEVRFANVPSMLYRYRTYPEQDRRAYRSVQLSGAQEVRRRLLRHMGLEPSKADMECHLALALLTPQSSIRSLLACRAWAQVLLAANERANIYDAQIFHREVEGRWRELWRRSVRARLPVWWVAYVPECIRVHCCAVKKALLCR